VSNITRTVYSGRLHTHTVSFYWPTVCARSASVCCRKISRNAKSWSKMLVCR